MGGWYTTTVAVGLCVLCALILQSTEAVQERRRRPPSSAARARDRAAALSERAPTSAVAVLGGTACGKLKGLARVFAACVRNFQATVSQKTLCRSFGRRSSTPPPRLYGSARAAATCWRCRRNCGAVRRSRRSRGRNSRSTISSRAPGSVSASTLPGTSAMRSASRPDETWSTRRVRRATTSAARRRARGAETPSQSSHRRSERRPWPRLYS